MKTLVIVPTHRALDYAALAVESVFLTATPDTCVLVVDDATPDWKAGFKRHLERFTRSHAGRLLHSHFDRHGGLTRSWNSGLVTARELHFEAAVCTNSDVLFTPGWQKALAPHLATHVLLGPVSNAPGSEDGQRVGRFLPDYKLTDERGYLAKVAARLWKEYAGRVTDGAVNGFCMAGLTASWWAYEHSPGCVFDPALKMTLQEYELQKRVRKAARTGFVPAWFVFHYRAVSRGVRHKKRGWYRRKGKPS